MSTMRPSEPRLHFFIGKGGAGKSTLSAISALNCSFQDRTTLLVSMDPAHNQRDIFKIPFSETPRRINAYLKVREIDIDQWTHKVIKQTRDRIKRTYAYHSAFNLDGCLKVLELSPGLEEQALASAFQETVKSTGGHDHLIFDMPPTALSLRFFSLPVLNLAWINELLVLRKRIHEKREIISRIKLAGRTVQQDPVTEALETLQRLSEDQRRLFASESTRIHLVVNPEPLSMSEAIRFRDKLKKVGLTVTDVVCNKAVDDDECLSVAEALPGLPIFHIPRFSGSICGMDALTRCIEQVGARRLPAA